MDDSDLLWLLYFLDYQLYFDLQKKQRVCLPFFCRSFLSRIVCLVFFLCYPTTLVRPAVEGEGIFYDAIRFLYKIDAPTNLFPPFTVLSVGFAL